MLKTVTVDTVRENYTLNKRKLAVLNGLTHIQSLYVNKNIIKNCILLENVVTLNSIKGT